METDYFINPNRLPLNADGPFYTTGYRCSDSEEADASTVEWGGHCLACEAPEMEAPDLLAPLTDGNMDTYFRRQPVSSDEIDRACQALQVCCLSALRYGGKDLAIIRQLHNDPEFCDYVVMPDGELRLTLGADGELLPFARRIIEKRHAAFRRKQLLKKWWPFG